MKLSNFGKFIFFTLSYYLLFIILIIDNNSLKYSLNFKYFNLELNWVLLLILTIFVIISIIYIFKLKKLPKKVFQITEIKNISAETLNYLITFILGLFFFDGTFYNLKIIILLLLLYLIYQSGGIYYLQPILMLLGYQVYKCKIDNQNEIMILTKDKISINKIELCELFEGIYLFREASNVRN